MIMKVIVILICVRLVTLAENEEKDCEIATRIEYQILNGIHYANIFIPPNFMPKESFNFIYMKIYIKTQFSGYYKRLYFMPTEHKEAQEICFSFNCGSYVVNNDFLRLGWNNITLGLGEKLSFEVLNQDTNSLIWQSSKFESIDYYYFSIRTLNKNVFLSVDCYGDVEGDGILKINTNYIELPLLILKNSKYLGSDPSKYSLNLVLKSEYDRILKLGLSSMNGVIQDICVDGSHNKTLSTRCSSKTTEIKLSAEENYNLILPLPKEIKKDFIKYEFSAPSISFYIHNTSISLLHYPLTLRIPVAKTTKLYKEFIKEIEFAQDLQIINKKYDKIITIVSLLLAIAIIFIILVGIKYLRMVSKWLVEFLTSKLTTIDAVQEITATDARPTSVKSSEYEICNNLYVTLEERSAQKEAICQKESAAQRSHNSL